MEVNTKEIMNELKAIRLELTFLKKHIVDVDVVLTDADVNSLETAEKDLKTGRTKRLV